MQKNILILFYTWNGYRGDLVVCNLHTNLMAPFIREWCNPIYQNGRSASHGISYIVFHQRMLRISSWDLSDPLRISCVLVSLLKICVWRSHASAFTQGLLPPLSPPAMYHHAFAPWQCSSKKITLPKMPRSIFASESCYGKGLAACRWDMQILI